MDKPASYRRLRAPRESGRALVEPPFSQVGRALQRNALVRHRLGDVRFLDRPIHDLRGPARDECVRLAVEYTRQYRDAGPLGLGAQSAQRLVLAGHQPELFHPGVWFKSFLLDRLARDFRATAINLVVDNDACRRTSIRVPGGSVENPSASWIPFASASPQMAWEECRIADRDALRKFGATVAGNIRPLVPRPIIADWWPKVVARSQHEHALGTCLAQARHQLEGEHGLNTLELPVSRLCRLEAFAWFAAHIATHARRVHDVYNSTVIEYRKQNHIRSAAHPVPNLAADGEWREVPLWVWRRDDPVRRRLYVDSRPGRVTLSDHRDWRHELPLSQDGDNTAGLDQWLALESQGVKIRPRALLMTMFARLVIGDLFLHGIGGAKYDELTDVLIHRLFLRRAPGYIVATATTQLPIARERVTAEDARRVDRLLRELTYHPERHADLQSARSPEEAARLQNLIASKDRWIHFNTDESGAEVGKKARHVHLEVLNRALQPWVESKRAAALAHRESLARALRGEAILASREYAFCLYPEEMLVPLLKQLAASA
jgi:hypothetical protein